MWPSWTDVDHWLESLPSPFSPLGCADNNCYSEVTVGGKNYWLVDHSCSPDYVSASGSHCSWPPYCMNAVTHALSPSLAYSEPHLCLSLQMNQVQIGLPQAGCGK